MGSSQQFPRLFTVNEANDLLPELRPLVQRVFYHLDGLRAKSETVIRGERLSPDSPELMKRLQQDTAIARMILEVKGLVEEINSYGCMCKGIEEGLIDFPCLLGGEIVFLCWRYDEESVAHWHRIEDGFAGRKALLEADDDSGGNVSYH